MKKNNRKKQTKQQLIAELAGHLESEVAKQISVVQLANGAVGYKDYLIRQLPSSNWGLYSILSKDLLDEFYLKSSALMAAKSYDRTHIDRYIDIKQMDRLYWSNYSDSLVYKKNIKTAKDFDRYLVLLNKLEHSEFMTEYYKQEITRTFKWSFV